MFVVLDLVFWQKCWEHSPQVGPLGGRALSHCHHLHQHQHHYHRQLRDHHHHRHHHPQHHHPCLLYDDHHITFLGDFSFLLERWFPLTSGGAPGGEWDSIAPSRLSHTGHPQQPWANLKKEKFDFPDHDLPFSNCTTNHPTRDHPISWRTNKLSSSQRKISLPNLENCRLYLGAENLEVPPSSTFLI